MTISENVRAAMRRMFYVDHQTINAIAEEFSVHHSTVRRALNQDFIRHRSGKAVSIIDGYRPQIEQLLKQYPKMRGSRIFKVLKRQGFKGSVNTVRRVVAEIRPRFARAYVPVEVLPGEEAQMDWAHAGTIQIGRAERKLYCFVMTLSWSRAAWVQLTLDMETETLLRCHTAAFQFFGGVPKRILYDNMKTVVIDRIHDVIRFNPKFLEFASWYCFEPRICDPFQPQQKGRVERNIRSLRDGLLHCYQPKTVEEMRRDIEDWQAGANRRQWPGGKHTTVDMCLEKERQLLTALPRPIFPKGKKSVRSGRTPLVRFDLNEYTIDPKFVRHPLALEYDEDEVTLFSGEVLVAKHKRCWSRDETIRDPVHIEDTFALASSGQGKAYARSLLLEQFPESRDLLQKCQELDLPLSRVERTLMELATTYGRKNLADAIKQGLERQAYTPEAIMLILRTITNDSPARVPLNLPHRPGVSDLDIKSHDLSEYDHL